ncbi:MAG: glycosyltransferase, partial [Nitrospirales bacterium]
DPVHDDGPARGRSPLKLFESWAVGVPFVTADVGDRHYLLGNPPAGVLVEPGDADALAVGVCSILTNSHLSTLIVERGIAEVKKYYWYHLASELSSIYMALFERKSLS